MNVSWRTGRRGRNRKYLKNECVVRRVIIVAVLILSAFVSSAQSHLFEDAFNSVKNKSEVFKPGGEWFPYPAYEDRAAWDKLCGPFRDEIYKKAEKYLNYDWELFRATAYLEYEKTGNRKLALCEEHNREAIIALTLAELCDGSGKYIPQLIDGLWYMSQQYSWAHFQHTGYQKSRRTLPTDTDYVISLHNASTAACIAIAYHFFKDKFDSYDPSIAETIYRAVDRQILTPFMNEALDSTSHRIWTGFCKTPGKKLNNWTPFCDHHVLTTYLLMERDPERLLKAVERSVKIMDLYMSDVASDGACDEGPGYWSMSFGKVYDYARTLCDVSGGKANVFSDQLIRRMGEYKSKTYFDGGWTLSFGDCTPRDAGGPGILFRYGYDTRSRELMELAVYLLRNNKLQNFKLPGLNISLEGTYRQLETLRYHGKMVDFEDNLLAQLDSYKKVVSYLRSDVRSEYYPVSGYAVIRKGQWNLGCKGSHNGESHNHNDVGSAILIWDTMPVVYDCGTGTYVKETFSAKRYTIWSMQSQWHATPSPNGIQQQAGAGYASKDTSCDLAKGLFTTDISGAYPENAHCSRWVRTYKLGEYSCKITDQFTLSERTSADVVNFPIRGSVALPGASIGNVTAKDGEVLVKVSTFEGGRGGIIHIKYSPNLKPCVEVREITDKRLKRCSGDIISRLYFQSAPDAPLEGEYSFEFIPQS